MMWLAATLFALAIATVGARVVRATGDTPHRWLSDLDLHDVIPPDEEETKP